MPYFVYAVRPFAQIEQQGEHASFKDAAAQARALRAQQAPSAQLAVKVMFAETALQAEDLLLQVRERRPSGEE